MIINRAKNPIVVRPIVVGQARRLPAVIPSATPKAFGVALQTRSRPVTTSTRLFLFLKLDLLAEELRIAGVFRQKRYDRAWVVGFHHFIADIP